MFVYSVRASALRFAAVMLLSVAALAVLLALVPSYVPASLFVKEEKLTYDHISTPEERVSFLSRFGWSAAPDSMQVSEVTVPARFDAVYEDYNRIQKEQGLDLSRYRGKNVMRYTYDITNYKGADGRVLATLLVYKDRVIGGDVCSADGTGFVHGFEKP